MDKERVMVPSTLVWALGLEGPPPPRGQQARRGRGRPWGGVHEIWFLFPVKMMALGNRLLRRFCWAIIKLSSA